MISPFPQFLFAALVTLTAPLRAGELSATTWPAVRGDAALSGVSPSSLKMPLAPAWTYQIAALDEQPPTPVIDGQRAFIGDGNGVFHAIEIEKGTKAWTYELIDEKKQKPSKAPIQASACLSGELVIFGDLDGFVWALKKTDGSKVWKWEARGEIKAGLTPVTLTFEGKKTECVLVGDFAGQLACLEAATGKELWKTEGSGPINGAPSLGEAGVAFGGCDGSVMLADPITGKPIGTKVDTQAPMPNSVAQRGPMGYFAHAGRKVEGWDLKSGKQVWAFRDKDFEYFTSPAVTESLVLAGGKDKRLHALDLKTGEEKWAFRARNEVGSSAVVAGGYAVFGSDDGRLYVANLSDGSEAWSRELGADVKASPAVAGGKVYVLGLNGQLHCFTSAP